MIIKIWKLIMNKLIVIGVDLGIVNNAIGVLTNFKVNAIEDDRERLEYFFNNTDRKVVSFINWFQTQKLKLMMLYPDANFVISVENHDWVKGVKGQSKINQSFALKNAVFLNKLVGVLEAIADNDDAIKKIYYFKPYVVKKHYYLTQRMLYLPKTPHEQDAMELAWLGMDKYKTEPADA